MKTKLTARCLSMILSILMILSCIIIPTFAEESDNTYVGNATSSSAPQSSITFENGIFTYNINAELLAQAIADRTLSKETLKTFIPSELVDAIFEKDIKNAANTVLSLLKTALTESGESIDSILPVSFIREYLLGGEDPLIWQIVDKDTIIGCIDIDKIVEDIKANGELSDIVDMEALELYISENGELFTSLISDEILNNIIEDLKTTLPDRYNELTERISNEILNNPELSYIKDAILESVKNNSALLDRVADILKADSDAIKGLLDSCNREALESFFNGLSSDDKDTLIGRTDKNAIYGLLVDSGNLDNYTNEETIEALYNHGYIDITATEDEIKEAIKNNFSQILNDGIISIDNVINDIGGINRLIEENIISTDMIFDVVDSSVIVDSNLFSDDAIIDAIGGVQTLIDKEIISTDMIFDVIGNDFSDIVSAIGGYGTLIDIVGTDIIIENIGMENIINTLGTDTLMQFVDINAVIDTVGLENIINNIDRDTLISAIDKEKLKNEAFKFIGNNIKQVSLNGESVYTAPQSPWFDMSKIENILFDMIPTFDEIAAVDADGIIFDFSIGLKLFDGIVSDGKTDYTLGIRVKLTGDLTKIKSYAQKITNYISISTVDNKTSITVNAPQKFTTLFLRGIDSEKLPDSIRTKILDILNSDVSDETLNKIIDTLTIDELLAVLDSIDFDKLGDVIIDNLDGVYASAYDRMLSITKRAVNAMTIEKLEALAQKLNITISDSNINRIERLRSAILSKIDSFTSDELKSAVQNGTFGDYKELIKQDIEANRDTLEAIRSYMVRALNRAMDYIPERILGSMLSDLYDGNGCFSLSFDATYDITNKIADIVSAKFPAYKDIINQAIAEFATNTKNSRSFDIKFNVKDIYEVEFNFANGDKYIAYLPSGAPLTFVSENNTAFEGKAPHGWSTNADAAEISQMPNYDVLLYERFAITVEIGSDVQTVYFTDTLSGKADIEFPEIPSIPCHDTILKVFSTADQSELGLWDDIQLSTVHSDITVKVEYVETEHNYGEWAVTKTPTIDSEGELTRVCADDATHIEKFVLPKLNKNDYEYTRTAPTCDDDGVESYVYTKDGQTFTFNVTLPATSHNFGEWSVTKAPTLDAEGELTRVCANDGNHKETFTLPKLNNTDYTYTVTKQPTCEENGSGKYTYTKDGKTFDFTVELAATGHSWGEWSVTKEPTADAEGELTRVCANDGSHKETFTLPKLNDTDYKYNIITPPTQSSTGTGRYTYTKDNQEFTFDVTIPALPVTPWNGKYDKPAYYDFNGEKISIAIHQKTVDVNDKNFPFAIDDENALGENYTDCIKYGKVIADHMTVYASPDSNKAQAMLALTSYKFVSVANRDIISIDKDAQFIVIGIPSGEWARVLVKKDGQWILGYALSSEFEIGEDLKLYDDTISEKDYTWLIILIIVIVLLIVAVIIFIIFRKKKQPEPTNEPEIEPEPESEPEPETSPEYEPTVDQVLEQLPDIENESATSFVASTPVDSVMADQLMTDEEAIDALAVAGNSTPGKKVAINIGIINDIFEAGETVDIDSLKAHRMIPSSAKRIKIIANGVLDKPLTFVADEYSAQAIKMITLTGGTCQKLN